MIRSTPSSTDCSDSSRAWYSRSMSAIWAAVSSRLSDVRRLVAHVGLVERRRARRVHAGEHARVPRRGDRRAVGCRPACGRVRGEEGEERLVVGRLGPSRKSTDLAVSTSVR